MPDKSQDSQSRTGSIPRQQVQEALRLRETARPAAPPDIAPDAGSATGIMPVISEADDAAPRDTDAPTGK